MHHELGFHFQASAHHPRSLSASTKKSQVCLCCIIHDLLMFYKWVSFFHPVTRWTDGCNGACVFSCDSDIHRKCVTIMFIYSCCLRPHSPRPRLSRTVGSSGPITTVGMLLKFNTRVCHMLTMQNKYIWIVSFNFRLISESSYSKTHRKLLRLVNEIVLDFWLMHTWFCTRTSWMSKFGQI